MSEKIHIGAREEGSGGVSDLARSLKQKGFFNIFFLLLIFKHLTLE